MIVELFGPPGAGKSTFARTIAARLRERGLAARTLSSARRSEAATLANGVSLNGRTSTERRNLPRKPPASSLEAVNRELMRRLPPHSWLWRLRLQRYLGRLAAAWSDGQSHDTVIIFDQGYTQALCSLTSLTRGVDLAKIDAAASLLPAPALRICVQVPHAVLLARHEQRVRERTFLESVLELDLATNLAQAGICAHLRRMFEGQSATGPHVPMLCPDPMDENLECVLDAIAESRTGSIIAQEVELQ